MTMILDDDEIDALADEALAATRTPGYVWALVVAALMLLLVGCIYYSYQDGAKADWQGAGLERMMHGGTTL